jgi:tetratricopeptide (TPR) repeat protein
MRFKPYLYFILISFIFSACTPSNEELFDKAYKLGKQQKYDEAIKIYTQIISRNNQLQLAYYNRGIDYLSKKSYNQALADFNKVLSLQTVGDFHVTYNENTPVADDVARTQVPYNDALYQRAIVKFYMDSARSSFIDFQTLVDDNDEQKSNCIIWQGTLWVKIGKLEKACEYFHKAKQFANTTDDKQEADEMIKTYCSKISNSR